MRAFNVHSDELEHQSDQPGYRWRGVRGIGEQLGGKRIGASLFELDDGELTFPYHHHHGIEEWLLVLAGTPTARTPDGEQPLAEGDLVCFHPGPPARTASADQGGFDVLRRQHPVDQCLPGLRKGRHPPERPGRPTRFPTQRRR